MFLPISRSIYCGALSPSALEARHCADECLRRDVQKLMFLPFCLAELTKLLSDVLRSYGAEFPSFPAVSSFPANKMYYPDFYSPICAMREDELDCMLRLAPGMEVLTPRYSFYSALLRGEVRWLKLNLAQQIEMLRSDNDARILLLRVLDEIYSLVGQVGDFPGGLKVALGALYLDLTIVFGSLLRSTDYLDYHAIQCGVCFCQRTLPDEERKYAILQNESQVKSIVNHQEIRFLEEYTHSSCTTSSMTAAVNEECAGRLYGELAALTTELPADSACQNRLWRGITALENHLFFLYSGLPVENGDHYSMFTDGCWIGNRFIDLRRGYYSKDRDYSEGRTAYDWIDSQLDEHCFTFLSPLIAPEDSLPRRLRIHLLKRRGIYKEYFVSTFPPVGGVEELSTVPVKPFTSKVVDDAEVHRMLAFLHEDSSSWLLQSGQAQRLETLFCHFLHTNKITPVPTKEKLKIRSGYSEQLYGLFLHYCDVRNGDADNYAKFLMETLVTQATPQTFYKNGARYVRKYTAFCKQHELDIPLSGDIRAEV